MIRAKAVLHLPKTYGMVFALLAMVGLTGSFARGLDEESEKFPRFESQVLPIFQANCLICHGDKVRQVGLDLRTSESILRGGESGPAVVPGTAEESLLFEKISSGAMPMAGDKLSREEIGLIQEWINAGALSEGEDPHQAKERGKVAQVTEREVMVTILHLRCLVCHGRQRQEGGLDVQTRAALLKGGNSGPAIIPGKPEESLLIKRIVAKEMPPPDPELLREFTVRPVTSNDLQKLRQWIAAGAPAEPAEVAYVGTKPDPLVSEEDRQFWSFQSPQRPPVPPVRQKNLVRTPIDAFLLGKLEAKGLSFSPEADRLTLMRRAYFDLIGLPPGSEEIEAHLKDQRPDAYEWMIERLLASPHYGERWARYWLDPAGYSDSEGKVEDDLFRPHFYRYRDYVIRSLNNDKPYDRFLVEQIAGDELFDYKSTGELTPDQLDSLVATGFLRTAPDGTYSLAQNTVPDRLEILADEVDIFTSAVLGLTMGCARCHDHKYDPIPQRDYYRFSAIFRTAYDPYDWLPPNKKIDNTEVKSVFPKRYLATVPQQERREVEAYNAPIQEEIQRFERSLEAKAKPLREKLFQEKLAQLPEVVREDIRKALQTAEEERNATQKYLVENFEALVKVEQQELEARFEDFQEEAKKIKEAIQAAEKRLRPEPKIRALFDMGGSPTSTYVLRRADYLSPGQLVQPGVPSVLRDGLAPYKVTKPPWKTDTSGRRLALARWLVQPNHPLTARVMVNRIWQHHFGTGLVATPGNFGRTGAPPTHPKLLDWLAIEFVRGGWSLKKIHKLIMTSTAYRQSSRFDASRNGANPDNILLSRFPLRRLDADAIRDSIFKVARRIDFTPFGPPEELEVRSDGEVINKCLAAGCRRSIYTLQRRTTPVTMLEAFDAPQMTPNCLKRAHSTVSSQALQMMNSEMVRESSRYFAGRVMDAVGGDVGKQIERVYLESLCRRPSTEELKLGETALRDLTRHWQQHLEKEVPAEPREAKAKWLALAAFCHTIMNSAEFIYID